MNRKINKININGKTLLVALLTLGMFVSGVGSAYAVTTLDATAQFTAGVAGASELLDFNSGGSQIYDDWNLHIVTDDDLYIAAPGTTYVSGAMDLTGNLIVGNGNAAGATETITLGSTGSSSIYDDWNMHIVTDDALFIDAPGTTTVSGALTVTGDVTVNGGELYVTPVASSASTTEGTVYYDSTDDNLYVYANGAFVDLTAGATGAITLDTAYNTSAGAAAVTVDAGSVTWALTDDSDFVVNINSAASEFKLQDAGTDAWAWDSDATLDVTPIAIGSDLIDITRHNSATAGDVFDIDMGTAAIAGDALDISWGGAATGDSIAIDMDNNLEGAALAVTSSSGVRTDALIDIVSDSTAGDYIFLDVDGATAGHGINFDVDGAMTGNLLNVNYGTGAATGDVLDVTMGTNVSGGVLAVTSVNTSGTLIDLNVDPATASTVVGMNIDYGTAAVSGNMLDLNFSNLAHTGAAIDIDMGDAAVGAQALVLNTADGVGTASPIVLTYNNTSGQFALMDIDYDGTRGGILDINLTGIFTDEHVIDIDTNKAFTSNIIDITTATVASAGNLIDLNFGNTADTGNAIDVSMGAAAVGAQGLVMTTSAGIRTASAVQITESNTTGAVATIDWDSAETRGGFMDIDFTGALAGENLIDIDPTAAWTSSLIDITTGGGTATGDVMNVTLTAGDVATQAFVVTNSAVTTTDGWLMGVNSSTAFTGNAYSFDTTGAFTAAANVWAFDSSGNSVWAGDIFNIDTGAGAATGDVFDVNIETNAVNVKTLVVDNASISDSGNDGWLIDVDTTAAFAGDMISFTNSGADIWTGSIVAVTTGGGAATGDVISVTNTALDAATQTVVVNNAAVSTVDGWLMDVNTTAAWTGKMIDIDIASTPDDHVFDLTYAGAATGNAFDLNMVTNVAGDAINIDTEATTGHAILIDSGGAISDSLIDIDMSAGDWQGNIFEIETGSIASDGDIFNILNETNDLTTQVFVVDNDAISSTDGWLMHIIVDGAATGDMIFIDDDASQTGDGIVLDYEATTTGDLLRFESPATRTDGSVIQIDDAATGTADAPSVDINVTGAVDLPTVDIDSAGVLVDNEGVLSVAGSAARVAGSSVLRVSATGAPAAATSYLVDFDYSGATMTNNPITAYVNSGSSTNSAIYVTGSGVPAANTGTLHLVSTNTGTTPGVRIALHHDKGTPAAGDIVGEVSFLGDDSGNAITEYASITAESDAVTAGSEVGKLFLNVTVGGTTESVLELKQDTLLVGDGSGDAEITSSGAHNLTLETNDGTNSGTIVITDGANGNITIDADGTGLVVITGMTFTTTAKTTTATLTQAESGLITADSTGGAFSLTLPAVASSDGVFYMVKKIDAAANAVTLDGNASETIEGAATWANLDAQYDSAVIVCDGTEWWTVAEDY